MRFSKLLCCIPLFITPAIFADAAKNAIPTDGLVAYYPFTDGSLENASATAPNIENKGASFGKDRFGNPESAAVFDGESYMEIPDDDAFSISTTGALTVSVWVSPSTLNFKNAEEGGYVHWMGKGMPQQHEWVFRMYNKELTGSQENRPNRMSAYAFNLKGGLGSGSYVQEKIQAGEWIHFAARYDVKSNTITLFKNGIQKDQDPLYDETYGVQVENGNAPVRLGTRSLWSFFEGSIDDLRFYNRALSDEEIATLYNEQNPAENSTESPGDSAETSSIAKLNVPKINSAGHAHHGFQNSSNPYHIFFNGKNNRYVDSKGRTVSR